MSDQTTQPVDARLNALYPSAPDLKPEPAPEEVQTLRDSEGIERTLYPAQHQYAPDVLSDLARASNPDGQGEAFSQQQVELAAVAQDVGFTEDDLRTMTSVVRQHSANPPTSDALEASRIEALTQLRQTYGDRADQVIKDTQQIVARDPRLAAYVHRNGLGANPAFIVRVAALANSARARGKLK